MEIRDGVRNDTAALEFLFEDPPAVAKAEIEPIVALGTASLRFPFIERE
jgi:hypothetical protein